VLLTLRDEGDFGCNIDSLEWHSRCRVEGKCENEQIWKKQMGAQQDFPLGSTVRVVEQAGEVDWKWRGS
jgi:hypothetical protein